MRAICLILFAVVVFVTGDSFQQANNQNTEQDTNAESVNVPDLSQGGFQTPVDNINMPAEQQQEQQSASAHNSQDSVHSRSSWPSWIRGYPVPNLLPNPSQTHTYPYPQYPVLQRPVNSAHVQNSWHPRSHHNSQVPSVDQSELEQQQELPYFPNLPWISQSNQQNSNNYPYPSQHSVQQNQQQHQNNRHLFWDEYKNINEDGHDYAEEESYNWKPQLPSFLFSSKNDESYSAHNRLGRGVVYYRRHFPSTQIPQRRYFPY